MKRQASNEFTAQMINREEDIAYVMSCIADADCCSIVGLSNMGKSTLLRSLPMPAVQTQQFGANANRYLLVYVDFNLISQVTEQGIYEVILRNVLEALEAQEVTPELKTALRNAYQTVIAPDSPFRIPLAFEDSLKAILDQQPRLLVLLLDEFDEVFAETEPRVFVRLRALKDRYWPRLCYVTATAHPLSEIRHEREVGEFCELFAAHVRYLAPLSEADARALVQRWATRSHVSFTASDEDFIVACAGGHPSLLLATCRTVAKAKEEAILRPSAMSYEHIREGLDSDTNIRLECAKLWNDLTATEQEALIALLSGQQITAGLDSLMEKGIVNATASGRKVFSDLFAGFARRQQLVRRRGPQGIRIDVESGDVWVDGKLAPMLTDLEYKLLLLLYGNLDKICDKYKIVESVWGENYIDEVDDARIEKLVSRLREKLEPNPAEPKYLQTIRGRGYKLVSPE
ncbi:MAG: winged helix-turn-helix domain-containing protein [Anaerolineae bacterium]